MATFTWFDRPVPKNLRVTQVYGLVFADDGRMLLKVENKKGKRVYSLAGGTPEDFDKSYEHTLRREFLEEVNTELGEEVCYLGYLEVDEENGKPTYAQMLVAARIKNIGQRQPDPDNGETYERLLTTPERAIDLLGWGKVAKQQVEAAVEVAKKKFAITKFSGQDEWV